MRPLAVKVPTKDFLMLPGCCLHWPIGEKELLGHWIEAIGSKPNAYTILMGDSLDMARAHYRNHLRTYRADENSQDALDGFAKGEVRKLADRLAPIKKRIWGALSGNHYWEFADGTNSEQYLCHLLGIPYLGALGVFRVNAESPKQTLTVFAHHSGGTSGARTTGGDVNGVARAELAWDMDVYLMGHTHRRLAWKDPVMGLSRERQPRVVERTKVFARCGAFLKGFKEDFPTTTQRHVPSYAEKESYRASDLGWVEISVEWTKDGRPDFTLRY